MKIAILSGKGGTGKTLLAVNLSAVMDNAIYVDCDVEAPNGNLFYKSENVIREEIIVQIPKFDDELCNGCKKCVEFCQFHALAYVSNKPMLFPEVCHSCGGCQLVCEKHAIKNEDKVVGIIEKGSSQEVQVMTGTMKIGEVSGVPIVKGMFEQLKDETKDVIIDCPPGSSCMVMESIKDADYCMLVAEPTEFGRHNLEMVYDLVKVFHKPFGVVLNKCLEGNNPSEKFCVQNKVPMIGKIPFDPTIGKLNAEGKIIAREMQDKTELFLNILQKIKEEVAQ